MRRDADTEEKIFYHHKQKEVIQKRDDNLEETAANQNENRKAVISRQNENRKAVISRQNENREAANCDYIEKQKSEKSGTEATDWRALVRRAQQGDANAMEEMVEANIGLIHMVLKRMGIRGSGGAYGNQGRESDSSINHGNGSRYGGYGNYDREELFQVGAMGLVSAIKRFDLSTEYSFSTYAVPMILGEIRRFLRDDGMIHVGRRIKENAAQIARCKEQILREQNHEPTIGEIAKATGLSREDIILALGSSAGVESIQRPLGVSDDSQAQTLEEQLADEEHTDEQLINRVTVRHLLAFLTEDERKLIYFRYMEGRTQTETAGLLGMTQVSVSRLEKKILGKLRTRL